MAERSKIFVYIDPGFLHDAGHYRTWRQNLEREIVKRDVKLLHLVGKKVPRTVVKELDLIPVFKNAAYVDSNLDPSRIYKLGERFGRDLKKGLRKIANHLKNDSKIYFYMYTSHPVYIQEIAKYLSSDSPYSDRITAKLVLFYLDKAICNEDSPPDHSVNILQATSNMLERCDPEQRINLFMDSEIGISRYQPYFERTIKPHVMPLHSENLVHDDIVVHEVPVVGYFGYTTKKHGFLLLKKLVYDLERHDEITNYKFIFKISDKFLTPKERADYFSFVKHCRALNNFEIICSNMSNAQYLEYISKVDIVLLPYEAKDYRFQSSSVFVDAIIAGAATLVASGSWMANELGKINAGMTYENGNHQSFLEKFRILATNHAALRRASSHLRSIYIQNFLSKYSLDLVLDSTRS